MLINPKCGLLFTQRRLQVTTLIGDTAPSWYYAAIYIYIYSVVYSYIILIAFLYHLISSSYIILTELNVNKLKQCFKKDCV